MFYLPLVFILGFTYALTVDNCNAGAFLEMLTDDENTVSMPQIPVPCWVQKGRLTDTLGRCLAWPPGSATGRMGQGWSCIWHSRTWWRSAAAWLQCSSSQRRSYVSADSDATACNQPNADCIM